MHIIKITKNPIKNKKWPQHFPKQEAWHYVINICHCGKIMVVFQYPLQIDRVT